MSFSHLVAGKRIAPAVNGKNNVVKVSIIHDITTKDTTTSTISHVVKVDFTVWEVSFYVLFPL